jgi:putative tricarboxylic transport membrane protein
VIVRFARAAPYALVLAAAGVLYHFALRIDASAAGGRIGPDFWPRAILALLALLCVVELAKSFIMADPASAGGLLEAYLDPESSSEKTASTGRLLWGMGATLAYVLLVGTLGFFLATAAFLSAFIAIGGYRRWSVVAACGIGGSLAMVLVFMKVVYVSLPLGAGPFQALSVGLLGILGVR